MPYYFETMIATMNNTYVLEALEAKIIVFAVLIHALVVLPPQGLTQTISAGLQKLQNSHGRLTK